MLSPTNSFFVRILYILIPFSTLVAIIYSVLIWASVSLTEDYIVKYYLQREFDAFEREYAQEGNLTLMPNTSYLHAYWSNDSELPVFAKALDEGLHEIGDTHILIKKMTDESTKIYMILDESKMSSLDNSAPVRMGLLWALAGLIIIAGGLVAIFMARLISAPVVQLAKDLSRRPLKIENLKSNQRKDEVGVLSRVISGALKRLEEALDRESAFTRHVSHELRTPLSTIRNSLAILQLPRCDDTKRARNLQRLQHATKEMEELIKLFLCLGREQVSPALTNVNLASVVENVLLRHTPKIDSLRVQLLVSSKLIVSADAVMLKILIQNLINNAVQHGGQRILVAANQNSLLIANTRHECESAGGFGYGLEIVSRICQYAGWQLRIRSKSRTFSVKITGLG